jgi:hypothetical protein
MNGLVFSSSPKSFQLPLISAYLLSNDRRWGVATEILTMGRSKRVPLRESSVMRFFDESVNEAFEIWLGDCLSPRADRLNFPKIIQGPVFALNC